MHNENRSRQTQTSSTSVTNLNLQDTAGVTLAQSSGNTITVTDQGALRAGVDVALAGFDFGSDALSLADRSVGGALAFGSDALNDAVSFADRSSSRVLEAAESAGERSDATFARAFEFGRDLFDSSIETVSGVLREGQAQLGNTVTNLNAIARQQSTTEAERVQDIASQALKVGAVMVGLVALAFFMKGRA